MVTPPALFPPITEMPHLPSICPHRAALTSHQLINCSPVVTCKELHPTQGVEIFPRGSLDKAFRLYEEGAMGRRHLSLKCPRLFSALHSAHQAVPCGARAWKSTRAGAPVGGSPRVSGARSAQHSGSFVAIKHHSPECQDRLPSTSVGCVGSTAADHWRLGFLLRFTWGIFPAPPCLSERGQEAGV